MESRRYTPGDGYVFNTSSSKIEKDLRSAESGNNRVRITVGTVALQESPEPVGVYLDWPEFFKDASRPEFPLSNLYGNAPKVFEAFPDQASACVEDYEALQRPDVTAEEIEEIAERTVASLEERQEYVDVLATILDESHRNATVACEVEYYGSIESISKDSRERLVRLQEGLTDVIVRSSKELNDEVIETAGAISDLTVTLGALKQNTLNADILFAELKRDSDLKAELDRLKRRRGALVDEIPTSKGTKCVLNEDKLRTFIAASPELMSMDARTAKNRIVRVVEAMNLDVGTLEDKIERAAPKVEAAEIGINTHCRKIEGELSKLLAALESMNLEDGTSETEKLKQRVEHAIGRLQDAFNDNQTYTEGDLGPTKNVVYEAEDLMVTLANKVKDGTQEKGDQVLFALESAKSESQDVILNQKIAIDQVVDSYRAGVLKHEKAYTSMSKKLVDLRTTLSLTQREASLSLANISTSREHMEFQQNLLEAASVTRQAAKVNSETARVGYKEFFKGVTQAFEQGEGGGRPGEEAIYDLVLHLAPLNDVSVTLETIERELGQFISEGSAQLEVSKKRYQGSVSGARKFLSEHVTDGLSDLLVLGKQVKEYHDVYSDNAEAVEREGDVGGEDDIDPSDYSLIQGALDRQIADQEGYGKPSFGDQKNDSTKLSRNLT